MVAAPPAPPACRQPGGDRARSPGSGCPPRWSAQNLKISPRLSDLNPGDIAVKLLNLPDTFAASLSDQQCIEEILSARIARELNFPWHTTKHPMRMTGRIAAAPPPAVELADYVAAMDQLTYGQYFIGCGNGGHQEVWDANEEDPHAMDGGKKPQAARRTFISPWPARGCAAGNGSPRSTRSGVSLRILIGVPGFTLANDPRNVPQMWALIRAFRDEMDAVIDGRCPVCRILLADPQAAICEGCGAKQGMPHTLILEEINQLFSLFREHWEQVKEPKDRITDVPAWRDVKAVLHQGGQFGYRVVVGGQDLKDNVLFGARSQFGVILMTGFTPKQWGYAVGTTPVPKSPSSKGRFHLVRGSDHGLVQVVAADVRKGHGRQNELLWREFALNGRDARQPAPGRWRPGVPAGAGRRRARASAAAGRDRAGGDRPEAGRRVSGDDVRPVQDGPPQEPDRGGVQAHGQGVGDGLLGEGDPGPVGVGDAAACLTGTRVWHPCFPSTATHPPQTRVLTRGPDTGSKGR